MVIRKKTLFTLIGLIIVMLLSIMAFLSFRTHPIGDNTRVIYLGEEHVGSPPFSSNITFYYYGTDLSPNDLAGYLKSHIDKNDLPTSADATTFSIQTNDSNKRVPVTLYNNKSAIPKDAPNTAKKASQRYIFRILEQDYGAIKN